MMKSGRGKAKNMSRGKSVGRGSGRGSSKPMGRGKSKKS